jgi:hypothetical protein
LTSGVFVSIFFTSGEVAVLGEPVVAGEVEGAALGLVAGVVAGGVVTFGLFGASVLGSQAPKIAVEAAKSVAKTIDLLIDLYLKLSKTPERNRLTRGHAAHGTDLAWIRVFPSQVPQP